MARPTAYVDFGSCVASRPRQVADAHPSDQLGCDPFRSDHGFNRGHVPMEVPLVDALERPEVRAERRTGSFTGVAVHLASAIPVSIPGPLVHAMADGGVGRRAPPLALPCVGYRGELSPGRLSAMSAAQRR
jgi:hypothetical protein